MALEDFLRTPFSPKTIPSDSLIEPGPNDPDYLKNDLGKGNPLPWQRYFDPSVVDTSDKNSLASQMLSRDKNYFGGALGHGVGNDAPNFKAMGSSITPSMNAMSSAIARKYQKDVAGKLRGLGLARDQTAEQMNNANLGKAAGLLTSAQDLEYKNYKEQYDFQQQRKQMYDQWRNAKSAAEGNFLNNILGAAGTVAAFV